MHQLPEIERLVCFCCHFYAFVARMANSICPIIQKTEDCPGLNSDGKLPILDLKVWVDIQGEIFYEFYMKEMVRRSLMLARSAMPAKVKRASLTQEALRILRNTSPGVPALTAWDRMVEMDRT